MASNGFTAEDNAIIDKHAADLVKQTKKAKMREIVDHLHPQLRRDLTMSQSLHDPIIYHFTMVAREQLREQKAQNFLTGPQTNTANHTTVLPMPPPTVPKRSLTEYKVLSFDVYGSLVEYKSHILKSFQPLLFRLPLASPYLNATPLTASVPGSPTVGQIEFLKLFQKQEDAIKLEKPVRRFDEILSEIWRRIAREIDVKTSDEEAIQFGSEENIMSWPAFPGTIDALKTLSKRYSLVALSNIDKYTWDVTTRSPKSPLGEVEWWKVFTAEDFGDDLKRADETKLETMISFCEANKVAKDDILHVAQSLGHDHAPAKRLGLGSVFLVGDGSRWGKEAESKMVLEKNLVGYGWRCKDLKEFAGIVEEAFSV